MGFEADLEKGESRERGARASTKHRNVEEALRGSLKHHPNVGSTQSLLLGRV